jgi:hypothetical protein
MVVSADDKIPDDDMDDVSDVAERAIECTECTAFGTSTLGMREGVDCHTQRTRTCHKSQLVLCLSIHARTYHVL